MMSFDRKKVPVPRNPPMPPSGKKDETFLEVCPYCNTAAGRRRRNKVPGDGRFRSPRWIYICGGCGKEYQYPKRYRMVPTGSRGGRGGQGSGGR